MVGKVNNLSETELIQDVTGVLVVEIPIENQVATGNLTLRSSAVSIVWLVSGCAVWARERQYSL